MQICLWSFSLFVCCAFRLFALTNLHIELDWLIPDLTKFKIYWLLIFGDSNYKLYIWVMLFGHDSISYRIWKIQKPIYEILIHSTVFGCIIFLFVLCVISSYLYFDNYTFITPVRVLPKTFSTIFADASDFLRVGFLLSIPFSAALCARPSFFWSSLLFEILLSILALYQA